MGGKGVEALGSNQSHNAKCIAVNERGTLEDEGAI